MSEQNENKKNGFTAKILQVGTAECAIFFAVVAMVLAVLMLYLGFWKTLLIAALVCVGLFLGGVKNKKAWLAQWINRLFPPKSNVPYRATKDDLPPSMKAEMDEQTKDPQDFTEE
jgi:uncharacterized membrane protein